MHSYEKMVDLVSTVILNWNLETLRGFTIVKVIREFPAWIEVDTFLTWEVTSL